MRSRHHLAILAALAALLLPQPAAARPSESLVQALRGEGIAGGVWSIVDGNAVRVGAVGTSHRPSGRPMRESDKVHVGSVTKTLVALGVLRLVSEGRLSLDAPLAPLLPDIAFDNRWKASHPLRVRHLLDHTGGLEDARLWQLFSTRISPDVPLAEVVTRSPAMLKIRTPPGETFSYSNLGYTIAALLIERTTGERYERWLYDNLLQPLGMTDSSLSFVSQTGTSADSRLAWGHLGNGAPAAALPMAVRPASQFTTTAGDMARLGRFLLNAHRGKANPLVRRDLLLAMGRPEGTAAAHAGLGAGYALGLSRRDRTGRVGLCHQGDTVGYHALFCIYPELDRATFLSVNSDGDGIDLERIHAPIARAAAVIAPLARQGGPAPASADAWTGRYVPLVSRFAIERYADWLSDGVTLRREGAGLFLVRSGQPPLELHAAATGGLLQASGRSTASHVLLRRHDGSLLITDGVRFLRQTPAWQIQALWVNLLLGLGGALFFLVATPWLARRSGRTLAQPATIAILAFAPAIALIALTPFQRWGDLTVGSGALAAATLGLPLAALVQLLLAVRRRYRSWQADAMAAFLVLQWSVVLAAFELWPVMLWR